MIDKKQGDGDWGGYRDDGDDDDDVGDDVSLWWCGLKKGESQQYQTM